MQGEFKSVQRLGRFKVLLTYGDREKYQNRTCYIDGDGAFGYSIFEVMKMAVIKMNFLSETLGMQANVSVCLPSMSFADMMDSSSVFYTPDMKYQTLWLLHGGSGDENDFINFTNIVRYADKHKLAVVMPADYNRWYANSPQKGGMRFFDYLVEELPRVCRSFFPLSDKREDNFIGGLSMGMQGATKAAILHPEMYEAALFMSGAAMSAKRYRDRWEGFHNGKNTGSPDIFPAMGEPDFVENGPDDTFYNAKIQAEAGTKMPKMFITSGSKDPGLPATIETYEYFKSLGFDVSFEEVPGYGHEWDFWDLTLKKAIENWLPIKHGIIYPDKANEDT